MEQWQFLIQKEGERSWHPLEKPSRQITEGRYRVVARSNRTNTDVEVRVTHSSPLETPPIRRIQKRTRRINSEGLTVIIPFTYLKSGVWELQCSGDLMSDLLGASWQYTINLTVIPSEVEGKIVVPRKAKRDSDKQDKFAVKNIQNNQAKSKITNIQSSRNSSSAPSKDLKTNDAGLISAISIEGVSSKGRNITGKLTSTSPKTVKKAALNKPVVESSKEKLRESLETAADKQKAVSKKPTQKSNRKSSTTQNKAVSKKPAQKLRDSVKGLPQKSVSPSVAQKQSVKNTAKLNQTSSQVEEKNSLDKKTTSLNKAVSEAAVEKPSDNQKAVNKASKLNKSLEPNKKEILETPAQKGDLAIIEQNTDPVRVKGDTAEQILQNLIELALPSSEALLPDDNIDDTLATPPPLPLQLTLGKANYIASWGETITVEGEVLLKPTTDQQINQISQAELQIELLSPQNSQLIQSFRLPNPNKSIPFAIASLINIPEECSSKLILGEIKLYGMLGNSGTIELLASQSFTITAEIKELLAITVANPKGELEKLAYSRDKLSAQNSEQVSENSTSLDLELFNLVKTRRPEKSLPGVQSTKKSSPPPVEPRKLRRRGMHSPKLPNVPGYQEKINEYINKGYIETAYISDATGTSFPYLRKLEAITESSREIDEEVVEYETPESKYTTVTENQNNIETVQTSIEADTTSQAELVVDIEKDGNYLQFEKPITPRNSELIAGENLNTSPLIRQWMLSQGYSLPEPIDVEYEDYDIQDIQNIQTSNQNSHQHAPLSPNSEKTENSQALHQEQSQIDIKPSSSPYLSISTSSEWQVSQIAAPSNQIAQEFVVDDTDIFADNILEAESAKPDAVDDKAEKSSTLALAINTQKIEELPTPQLYVPQGELISGKSLNVRVRLPLGNSHLAVKLWLEDCQTRLLLDGPHLLTNLTPNKNHELEVITKLNIPFGCLEIRLEAVAINRTTQQESHKLTIQRTVIPPDLPNVQLDAILGM